MKTRFLFYLLGVLFLVSCENSPLNDDGEKIIDENLPPIEDAIVKDIVKKDVFAGYAQKGPFINGSSVLILELDTNLNQTGKSYSTSIVNNLGAFEKKNIELISNYVQLKVDGYYFNEITGKPSTGQISLTALVDVADIESANINVLTHLERNRVEYLVKEENIPFVEAKQQAQREILRIFSLEMPDITDSESLNLTDDAILLAISCILQGTLPPANMIELMSDISFDIATDGILDDLSLGSKLIDNVWMMSLPAIRKNVEQKYAEKLEIIIPDFEQYIIEFQNNTTYTRDKSLIHYPAEGSHGKNILSDETEFIKQGVRYSMKAELPEGSSLKIVLKGDGWSYTALPQPINWFVNAYDEKNKSQVFTVTKAEELNDIQVEFHSATLNEEDNMYYITIEYYENDALEPTRVRQMRFRHS